MKLPGLRLNAAFLKTKVARRVLFLFIVCALLPIGAYAVISFITVSQQLHDQSQKRLDQTSKSMVNGVLERLQFIDTELSIVTTTMLDRSIDEALDALSTSSLGSRVTWIAVEYGDSLIPILGEPSDVPRPDQPRLANLTEGWAALFTDVAPWGARVLLSRAIDPARPARGTVWAEVDPEYVFAGREAAALPPEMEMCVFDELQRQLWCSIPVQSIVLEGINQTGAAQDRGTFEWSAGGDDYLATYRTVFLSAEYAAPNWKLALSESQAQVLAPMTTFRSWFVPITLMGLWIVMLLSNIQIRRSMEPLVSLKDGTQRIAQREFDSKVEVTSNDEFQDLATSFNNMASRLGKQFSALTTINEIDRAVLSAFDTEVIIETLLRRTREVLACDGIGVSVSSPNPLDTRWNTVAVDAASGIRVVKDIQPIDSELQELKANPEFMITNGGGSQRSYLQLEPFSHRNVQHFLVLPVFIKQELAGVIALGHVDIPQYDEDDLIQARQLADQVAVALSNTRLVEELEELKIGALTALARTIDAKSPWTAGHSERVTKLALKVAEQMAISEEELEMLNRGGLLHDIGKLGIPPEVLDKPARLTEEEFAVIRAHPEIGARILKPITAYANVIPIVLYHHEKWDGTGYPEKLAGTDIPFLARLISVPDVFDAITSKRPYRSGMPHREAVEFITGRVGQDFDKDVVAAFRDVMDRELAKTGRYEPDTVSEPAAASSALVAS
ncbi:MAG: HD domain-containing protein [Gemmatimonadota bacterium]|nr:MAG: HD domain-containing protein [Gemmatimonadota bacterium]